MRKRNSVSSCVVFSLASATVFAGVGGATPKGKPASRPVNLVANGDFERPDKAGMLPEGWTTKHPESVRLISAGGERGRVVEMTGDKKLMATYGTDLLSGKIAVKPNTRYRCTGYTKSAGPKMIVFVKGYGKATRRVDDETTQFDDVVYQMRKEIPASSDWRPFHLDFDIQPAAVFSDFQHRIRYLRITLWAYWPAGTCWYDDIRFEEVGPIPEARRKHAGAVTHTGVQPNLNKDDTDGEFDEEQTWLDAANAWQAGEAEAALRLANRLIAHAPKKGSYRLLAARALAKLERWEEAEQVAQWLLHDAGEEDAGRAAAREIEPWQRDWATVVHAEVLLRTGRAEDAKNILNALLETDCSPHACQAAEKLLEHKGSPPHR